MAEIMHSPPICSTLPVFSGFRPAFMLRQKPVGRTTSCLGVQNPSTLTFPGLSEAELSTTSLPFKVRKNAPELIAPATPTPRELKLLSDIDDQEGFRNLNSIILLYPKNSKMGKTNPASVIREALAKVLVYYYPLAGRIKEFVPARKLVVDCNAKGVAFVEADANVTLEKVRMILHPPFPCLGEFVYDFDGPNVTIDSPLMYFQVTRLLCEGFVVTFKINHVMCDGQGAAQFLMAMTEMAQGALAPSILPIWQRELLYARNPPRVTYPHPEYDQLGATKHKNITKNEMTQKSFFFGPVEMTALRRAVPGTFKSCTTFEVLTACLWRCRTIALQPNPEEVMRLMMFVNTRAKFRPRFPKGYYGNCIVIPCAISTAEDLCNKPLGYALELVKKAKDSVTEEYVRSTADLMSIKGRPHYITTSSYIVSDHTRFRFNKLNFGWGEPIYSGYPIDDIQFPGVYNDYMYSTNDKGEPGIEVIIGMPIPSMEKFVKELNIMLK
ncbi:hypothetical protein QVD17_32662 [Tagetes erecta]|uniref:Uncharacterized protein n=1 Tax=Tagetes erecta TaxID=13708 RepID=A0AAD8NJF2_TARER|nr:hypothetical protein QVD17_32662 [Tagetes erecta]